MQNRDINVVVDLTYEDGMITSFDLNNGFPYGLKHNNKRPIKAKYRVTDTLNIKNQDFLKQVLFMRIPRSLDPRKHSEEIPKKLAELVGLDVSTNARRIV